MITWVYMAALIKISLHACFQADIKSVQKQLIDQLTTRIIAGPGPPTRALIAKCIAQVNFVIHHVVHRKNWMT